MFTLNMDILKDSHIVLPGLRWNLRKRVFPNVRSQYFSDKRIGMQVFILQYYLPMSYMSKMTSGP